jgi:hypothetical protein
VIRPTFREALLTRVTTTLRAVWAALMVAVFVYAALAVWLTRRMQPAFPSDIAATLTPALYALAVAIALVALWWRRHLAPEAVVAVTSGGAGPSIVIPVLPETDAERHALAAFARLQTQWIVVWAMSESLAIFGLVLSLGTADPRHVAGLGAAALILLGVHAPSRGRLETLLAALPVA